MELRNCSTKHFINTIRGGLVVKVCNINSIGRPVSKTKTLKDVYDSEDAKRLHKPDSGSVFGNKLAKHEGPQFLMATRTLREVKPEPYDSADGDLDSDLDDTLSQLKNRLFKKKRKHVSTNEKAVEDESDLNEPLINLKSKHSKATRAKRRCMSPCVMSSGTIEVEVKFEENSVPECSEQPGVELPPLIRVKAEVPDAEPSGSQNEVPIASPAAHNEVPNYCEKIAVPEYDREPLSNVTRYEECLTNEICYAHLEDVQPVSMLSPLVEVSIGLETMESNCEESLDSSLEESAEQKEFSDSCSSLNSSSDDPNVDLSSHSGCLLDVEDMPEECSSVCEVPDVAIDGSDTPQGSKSPLFVDKAESNLLAELDDSLNGPSENYSSNPGSIKTSSTKENPIFTKDVIADKEQPSTSSCITVMGNDFYSEGHAEDELLKALDKQNSEIQLECAENEHSLEDGTCDNADTISEQEQHQFPERLFSTRKAFSPSSEEQLCLAMNSVGIWDDTDHNVDSECKRKLFESQNGKKPSLRKSESHHDKKTGNLRLAGQVNEQKLVRSPRRISKRSHMAKGNLEGPRYSRTLPNLSTSCTSVQGCSESAVAFSQRQMHDMESVAGKLMNELKSMKDIVEQKLLFEAYRSSSLKNDADEVKSAISNAIKVEEMARKWMSTMSRDCSRFCKIMKMTPDSTSPSKETSPKGKRKMIKFADEAGGELCHVRFFNDSTASPASDAAVEE